MMKTQTEQVHEYLKENGSITSYEAFTKLGITRLSARIYDLRKAGLSISNSRVNYTGKQGNPKHYDVYRLRAEHEGQL
jgi:hypothetical protein